MAFLTKTDLKDVFNGLSSIYLKKGGLENFTTIAFDMDLPVTVDSLSISVSDPTLNRTKVHGLSADWTVSATPGEMTFSATVPSVDEELIKYFMGEANSVKAAVTTKDTTATNYTGVSASIKTLKLNIGLGLKSEDGEKLILVKNLAVYATPLYENASTTPFGFKLTGTVVATEGSDTEGEEGDDIAFLTKVAAEA